MTEGYSGKLLAQKLGVKPGDAILTIDAPASYAALVDPLPEGASISADATDPAIVHAFVKTRDALAAMAERLVSLPRLGGMLWISWPKKTSPLFTDLTENDIRDLVLPTGWVDVKVCAVDGNWSGLKFLKRRGDFENLTRLRD